MTKKQRSFKKMITDNMVDYNEDFQSEFINQRIEKISDEQLKDLLEMITTNKDKIGSLRATTYKQFVYYADKLIEANLNKTLLPYSKKVDQLYEKRELLLYTIDKNTDTISSRNRLIAKIESKELMFQDGGKNILDEVDYEIIKRFGFYNFFDPNKNYKIKESINLYLKEYTKERLLLNNGQLALN